MNLVLYIFFLSLLAFAFVFLSFSLFFKDSDDLFYFGYINSTPLKVEIADSEAERERGLSNRESLSKNEALLFVFPEPGMYGVWMKDMKIGIDVLWLDEDLKIIDMKEGVFPETYPKVFSSSDPSLYILEVHEGFIEEFKVIEGDKLSVFAYTPKVFTNKRFLIF